MNYQQHHYQQQQQQQYSDQHHCDVGPNIAVAAAAADHFHLSM